jgi:hypothetical protein
MQGQFPRIVIELQCEFSDGHERLVGLSSFGSVDVLHNQPSSECGGRCCCQPIGVE